MIAWLGSKSSQYKTNFLEETYPMFSIIIAASVIYFLISDGSEEDELSF